VRRLLALCLLLACKRGAAPAAPDAGAQALAQPPQAVAEAEPNDFQHPQPIPLRAIVRGTLSAPRDDDFFLVSPGPGQTVSLRVELEQADATLEVLDRDRNREVRLHGKLIPGVACRENCFVHVSGKGPQAYTLTVLAEVPRADRELEPNDRLSDAQALAPGVSLSGSFLSAEDQDWYRMTLPADGGQFLRVEVSAPGRPELEVRSGPDGALLASYRPADAGEGIFVRDLALSLGVFDAGVQDDAGVPDDAGLADDGGLPGDAGFGDGGADAGAPDAAVSEAQPREYLFVLKRGPEGATYTLTTALEPAPPDLEVEPNDDPQHATPLGATAAGYLSPKGDQDWYRVQVSVPSVLQAQVTGLAQDVELAAFDAPDGGRPRQLARAAEDGGTQILPYVALAPGDGWVRVRMRSPADEDREHLYHLSATVSPDDGSLEREPNDSVAAAQALTLPIAVRGFLWPKRDVDFFRFHVPADHEPVSIVLTPPRGLQLALRLYELHAAGAEVIGSSAATPTPSLISVPLKEGDYAVEVSSPRKDGSATEAYELRVSP
jgi:hypothetical protein